MSDDFRITAAQRRYLAAFDRWLREVWVPGLEGEGHPAEVERRVTLWGVVGETERSLESLPTAECATCGRTFALRPGPGRPRKHCELCRKPRRRVNL